MSEEEQQKTNEYTEIIFGEDSEERKKNAANNLSELYSNFIVKEEAKAIESISANIGLMSVTDYCSSFESDKEANCMTSMLFEEFNGQGHEEYYAGVTWLTISGKYGDRELTMSRWGDVNAGEGGPNFCLWSVLTYGNIIESGMYLSNAVHEFWPISIRPVFYLTNDIELSGEGTIDSPFTIGIE